MTRRPDASVLLAIAIHATLAAALVSAIGRSRFDWLPSPARGPDAPIERLRYATISPAPPIIPTTVPRAAAVSEPSAPPRAEAVAARAASVSSGTTLESTAVPGTGAASGDTTSSGGVVLRPESADPRIWSARSDFVPAEVSTARLLGGSVARGVQASNDSIAALGIQTVRPDWVVTRNGQRFGVDNAVIHLGKAKLPAVLLGLLPIRGFGCMPTMYFPDRPVRDSIGISCMQRENQTLADRAERINEMSAEIRARAPTTLAAREEIARIAARKDRERESRLRGGAATQPRSSITRPPS
jgi:hypothetical protein